MLSQPGVSGLPSPSQTNPPAPSHASFNPHAFPFLNNNFPQASNAALMTAAASLLQNTRGLPFINPNSSLFAGSNLEQPFDTSDKCNEDHQGSSEEGEKCGSTIDEGSDEEFQASRTTLDSPNSLRNPLLQRPSIPSGQNSKHIDGERNSNGMPQQPLDLSNKGLSSSSSSPSNSPLSASMKDTDDKEERGQDMVEEEEVILNLSNNNASSRTSSPITKRTHTSSIENATVMQVGIKTTTARPLSSQEQRRSSIPSDENQPSPQSTGKSPFPNLSAQGSADFTTKTSSVLLGLHAKQSSNNKSMNDVYRFGEEVVLKKPFYSNY